MKAAIYETNVFGVLAYHAKCMDRKCDWQSKRFVKIESAQRAAARHAADHFQMKKAQETS